MTQIEYCKERVKQMLGRVLTGNGITAYRDGNYSLIGGEELSDKELHVYVLPDLMHRLLINQPQALLDSKRAKY